MSFWGAFKNVFHIVETAAQIAAPIVATVDPVIGTLMLQSTNAVIAVESTVTDAKAGQAKADVVAATTKATIDAINSILISQGKSPLPANTSDAITATTATVVSGLNAVSVATTGGK